MSRTDGRRNRRLRRCFRFAAGAGTIAFLPGCSAGDLAGVAERVPRYAVAEGVPKTVLERALSQCPEKTEAEEAKCVKAGLKEAGTSVSELVAMIPGCHAGRMCEYRYATHDRLGFIRATSAEFVVHWTVSFDLRRPAKETDRIPVTVAEVGA